MLTETGLVVGVEGAATTGSTTGFVDGGTAPGLVAPINLLDEPRPELLPGEFEEGDIWMYSDEAEAGLAEAQAEVRGGQVKRFSSLDSLLGDLNAD